jgi:hypothetical protein
VAYSVRSLASCSLIRYPRPQANPAARAATKMTTATMSRTERGAGGRSSAIGAGRNTNSPEDPAGAPGRANSNGSGSSEDSLRARRIGVAANHRMAAAIETEMTRRMRTSTAFECSPAPPSEG